MSEDKLGIAERVLRLLDRRRAKVPIADAGSVPNLPSSEIVEAPHQYLFLAVVADDEIDVAENTGRALKQVFQEQEQKDGNVKIAQNVMDKFELALAGNAGKPADVVILDDAYIQGGGLWRPDSNAIIALAESSGISFFDFEKQVKDPWNTESRPIEVLCNGGNSTNFALILRALGYAGKIFVVSSAPPEPYEIRDRLNLIRIMVPNFPDKLPIDGISYKRDQDGHGLPYANSVSKDGRFWDTQTDPEVHYLSGTLGKLLAS